MKDKYINNSKENKNYTIRNKYVRLIFILMHLTFFVVMMIYYEKNKLIFCTAISMLYGPIIAYNLSPILDIFDDELKDLK